MRRRVELLGAPIEPLQGGKAGNKDPRDFISGNVPGQQWDIAQFAADRNDAYGGGPPPPIAQVMRRHSGAGGSDAVVRTVPTKVTTVAWTKNDSVHNNPVLLVPKNPNRIFLQLGNGNYVQPPLGPPAIDGPQSPASVFFSFGPPLVTNLTPQPFLIGHLLQIYSPPLIYSGDACPIDDVFVWWPISGFLGGTIFYCAYEGVVAPEGN